MTASFPRAPVLGFGMIIPVRPGLVTQFEGGSVAGVFGPPLAAWSFGVCIASDTRLHLPGIAFLEGAALLPLVLALYAFRADAAAGRTV